MDNKFDFITVCCIVSRISSAEVVEQDDFGVIVILLVR